MKKYFKLIEETKDANAVKFELKYSLGGYNYFTSENDKRGYYLSIYPVKKSTDPRGYTSESFIAFQGIRICVLECSRRSKKSEETAINKVLNNMEYYHEIGLAKINVAYDPNIELDI